MALIKKLTAIGDKLRSVLNTEEKFTLPQMPDKIDGVFEAGKQVGIPEGRRLNHAEFWDAIPSGAQKYLFAGPAWNADTFFPQKSFTFSGILTDSMFSLHSSGTAPYDLAQRLEDCGVVFDFSGITRANSMFYNCNVTRLPYLDLSSCTKLASSLAYSKNLQSIDGLHLGENTVFDKAFEQCTALEHVVVSGTIGQNGLDFTDCPLDRESLLSILNALKDGVSGLTVTLGESNLAKLTDSEKAIATGKGWQLQ